MTPEEMIARIKRRHRADCPAHIGERISDRCLAHDLMVELERLDKKHQETITDYCSAVTSDLARCKENKALRERIKELEELLKPKGPDHAD